MNNKKYLNVFCDLKKSFSQQNDEHCFAMITFATSALFSSIFFSYIYYYFIVRHKVHIHKNRKALECICTVIDIVSSTTAIIHALYCQLSASQQLCLFIKPLKLKYNFRLPKIVCVSNYYWQQKLLTIYKKCRVRHDLLNQRMKMFIVLCKFYVFCIFLSINRVYFIVMFYDILVWRRFALYYCFLKCDASDVCG